ncbi:MAG: hypothetical protein ABSC94_32795 [Polyangiaceae bacterium]
MKHNRALQRIAFDEQRRAPHADSAQVLSQELRAVFRRWHPKQAVALSLRVRDERRHER